MTSIIRRPPGRDIVQSTPLSDAAQIASSPAAAYLMQLQSEGSRRTQKASLLVLARIALGPEAAGVEVDPLVLPWHELTYAHVLALHATVAKRYAPATANRHLAALRGVLRECWRLGQISAEQLAKLTDLKPVTGHREPKGRMLDEGEIEALFNVAVRQDDERESARLCALLSLALSGLRLAEIATVAPANYESSAARLTVRGKGNKERVVNLPPRVNEHLERWMRLRGNGPGPILRARDKHAKLKKSVSSAGVRFLLENLCEQAGVENVSPHDFRRTYISRLLAAGADVLLVQKLAGHAKPETTAKYDKRKEEARAAAAALVDVPDPFSEDEEDEESTSLGAFESIQDLTPLLGKVATIAAKKHHDDPDPEVWWTYDCPLFGAALIKWVGRTASLGGVVRAGKVRHIVALVEREGKTWCIDARGVWEPQDASTYWGYGAKVQAIERVPEEMTQPSDWPVVVADIAATLQAEIGDYPLAEEDA